MSQQPGFNASGTDEASAGQYARREDVEEFKRKLNDAAKKDTRSWAHWVHDPVVAAVAATMVKQRKPAVGYCGYCGSRLTGLTCNECGERRLA